MKLRFLGIRIFEPRANQFDKNLYHLPIDIVLTRETYLDRSAGDGSISVEFSRWGDEKTFRSATFSLRTGDPETMMLVAKFVQKYQKWCSDYLKADTIHNFILFCALQNIPQVFYSDGYYFRSPDEKCYNWFQNGCSQGKVFAISQHQAMKRITKTGADMNTVRVEEMLKHEYHHNEFHWFKPEWIWDSFDFAGYFANTHTPTMLDTMTLWDKVSLWLDLEYNYFKNSK